MKEFALKYFNVLCGTFAGLNLTAISDFEEFYRKQILDSVLPLEQSLLFKTLLEKNKVLVDIGFGGGFPILPLAFLRPEFKYIGFESKRKKVEAVKIIKEQLNLASVKLYHQNIDDVFIDTNCLITLKAVGTCLEYLKKIHTNQTITVFFLKGPNFHELEGRDLDKIKKVACWEIIEEKFMKLENTDGRWLIGFKKINVPHRTIKSNKKNKKPLVNLSAFL